MNLLNFLDLNMVWESFKTPLRQAILAGYALAVNFLLNFVFNFIVTFFGFDLLPEQKAMVSEKLLMYGTPIAWAIIAFVDRVLHQIGKKTGSLRLTYGLTPYLEKIKNG